jgi:hypothetical protein
MLNTHIKDTFALYFYTYLFVIPLNISYHILVFLNLLLSGTIIRGTLKTPNSQLVTPISIKLQRPDGCD